MIAADLFRIIQQASLMTESGPIVEIYVAQNEPEAAMLQAMLENNGINARIVGGGLPGLVGEMPAGLPSAPRLWVCEPDADAAKKLLQEYEAKRRSRQSSNEVTCWTCPSCGSEVEFEFDSCWNCQHSRLSC